MHAFLRLAFLSLSLLPLMLPAQAWQTVHAHQSRFFERSGTAELWSILGRNPQATPQGDSMYYNYETIRDTQSAACLWLDAPSWSGPYVLRRPNGEEVYFNRAGDSIWMRPHAALGASWTLFHLPNGDRLNATVTSVAQQTVLGQADSTKTLTLAAVDSLGNPTTHIANGFTIQWSKLQGWVQLPAWYSFPDTLEPHVLTPLQMMTWGETYGWQPGDQYQYEYHNQPFQYTLEHGTIFRNILTRQDFPGDSIRFTFEDVRVITHTPPQQPSYVTTTQSIHTQTIHNASGRIHAIEPHEHVHPDSVQPQQFGVEYYAHYLDSIRPAVFHTDGRYVDVGNGCWTNLFLDPWWTYDHYIYGWGPMYQGHTGHDSGQTISQYTRLTYAQTSTGTWGVPAGLTESRKMTGRIKLWPQPAGEVVHVELPTASTDWEVELFDLHGRVLQRLHMPAGEGEINLRGLPKGMVGVRATGLEGTLMTGKLVKQ